MIPFRDNVPARIYPVSTITLILANLGAFAYQVTLPPEALEQLVTRFGVVPLRFQEAFPTSPSVLGPELLTLVTSQFLHGGLLHLLGNLWFLWIFGDNVEDRMGHGRLLAFYLLCGALAGAFHVFMHPGESMPAIGASGAIAGVLGAYLVSYPFARILTLFPLLLFWPIVELPALLVLGSWFFLQLFFAMLGSAHGLTTGVAWWAHVAGFIAGMLLVGGFARPRRRRYYWVLRG